MRNLRASQDDLHHSTAAIVNTSPSLPTNSVTSRDTGVSISSRQQNPDAQQPQQQQQQQHSKHLNRSRSSRATQRKSRETTRPSRARRLKSRRSHSFSDVSTWLAGVEDAAHAHQPSGHREKEQVGSSGDEKDVSEPSLRKLIEDHELAERNNERNRMPHRNIRFSESEAVPVTQPLFIDVSSTNDVTEGSSSISQNRAPERPICVTRSRTQTNTIINSSPERERRDEPLSKKERKLLEFDEEKEASDVTKSDVDSHQTEKSPQAGRRLAVNLRNKPKPGSDPDEMYRLPTEHLRFDRDYSNERIKSKRVSAQVQHQFITCWRDEIEELNERLREASIDGAVGGDDALTSAYDPHPVRNDGDLLRPYFTCTELSDALENHTIELTSQAVPPPQLLTPSISGYELTLPPRLLHTHEVFSSSEDVRTSPRTGAKPKKSPRKQKAL